MTHDEYVRHDATGLAARVRAGEVTPLELLEIALARIERLNPSVNAVVHSMEADARRDAARSPNGVFAGVPFLAKDLLSMYAGHPTSAGSRLLARQPMTVDSELAARVRATGVTIVGKTNTPEWGLLPTTEPDYWGPSRNPWDLERSPGGSSGGSGAAIAAGIVPMAGGGDGGGSIRIPSSCCGLFGLKPTRGRTPTGPRGLIWRGAAVEHVLTRSVRDSAAMLDATHGADPGAPFEIAPPGRPFSDEVGREPGRLRIAWTTEPCVPVDVHPDCVAAVHDAVGLLEELGHELIEDHVTIDGSTFAMHFMTVVAAELGADLSEAERLVGHRARRGELEPASRALGLLSGALSARSFAEALRGLEAIARDVGRFCAGYDLILTPTLSTPPPLLGTLVPTPSERRLLDILGLVGSGRLVKWAGLIDEVAAKALDFIPWTPIYNVTGQPAMSVPLYWNQDGLPIGVHLVGRFADEATLLRVAGQLERARPWFDRLAPIVTEI